MKIFSLVVLITTFLGAHPNKEGRSRWRTVLNLYCWTSLLGKSEPFCLLVYRKLFRLPVGWKIFEASISRFSLLFHKHTKKTFNFSRSARRQMNLISSQLYFLAPLFCCFLAQIILNIYTQFLFSLSLFSHSTTHTNYDSNKQRRSSLIIWVNTVNFTAFAFFLFN